MPPQYYSGTSQRLTDEDRQKRRYFVAFVLIFFGLATILLTVGTQTNYISEFYEAHTSHSSDLSHLQTFVKSAGDACDNAASKLKGARVRAKANNSIFVSMASYRDEECAPTLFDMYAKAKFPQDLFVGIVEQHDTKEGDLPCIPEEWIAQCQHSTFCPSDNVRVRKIAPKEAKGPTYGRYIGALMYNGERFYMMIDSHNRFVTHWDAIVVSMYLKVPYPKPVLSHYPEAWHNPKDKGPVNAPLDRRSTTTYLCKARILPGLGYLRLDGFVVSRRAQVRPQPWAAAGFLFAYGSILREVPFDPHLDYVFDGEEICYSARMWTHGWNMYSPSENILYHYYYRTKAKRFWGLLPSNWVARRDAAQRRIQCILEIYKHNTTQPLVPRDTKEEAVTVELDKYGLGSERAIADWYKWIGVDRKMWTTNEEAFCKKFS